MEPNPQAVAVTGAAGYVGKRLVERLLREERVGRVVGVDIRPAPLEHPRYLHLRQDIRAPLAGALADANVEAVAHLAFGMRQARKREEGWGVNVGGATSVLGACADAGVRKVVLLSSATVYGARPNNPVALTEDAPVRPRRGFAYAEDKAACEARFFRFARQRPECDVSVLRSCVIMGPNADNFITRALNKPALIAVRGHDPRMQFVHEDDIADILARFLLAATGGTGEGAAVYNVASPGGVRWSEVVAMAGKRLLALPAPAAYGLAGLAWNVRAQSDSPAAGLDLIRYPWTVNAAKLAGRLGYSFVHTSREAVESWVAARERR